MRRSRIERECYDCVRYGGGCDGRCWRSIVGGRCRNRFVPVENVENMVQVRGFRVEWKVWDGSYEEKFCHAVCSTSDDVWERVKGDVRLLLLG